MSISNSNATSWLLNPNRVIFGQEDPNQPDSGFCVPSRNYEQTYGANHVAGNEGPLTPEQQAQGGGPTFAARLTQLHESASQVGRTAQQLHDWLKGVELTLLSWGQKIDQFLPTAPAGVTPLEKLSLKPLPDSRLLPAWVSRHQAGLVALRTNLEYFSASATPLEQIPDQHLEQLNSAMIPIYAVSNILATLPSITNAVDATPRGGDVDADFLPRMISTINVAYKESQLLQPLLEKYSRIFQNYSSNSDGARDARAFAVSGQ